jgi:DNA-binding NtrC family response regulator
MGETEVDLKGARILLVDDQPANLDVLRRVLEAKAYKILLAPSGEVALRTAGRVVPDLILLDVMMPGMDGYEVCRRLKQDETTRAIPVIFVTAQDQTDALVSGFQAGGVDYIVKPFREEEVLVRVQTHLCLKYLAQELAEKNRELLRQNQQLEEEIALRQILKGQVSQAAAQEARRWGLENLVGKSPTMQRVLAQIQSLQEEIPVLIAGEGGTGKELIARAIHYGSSRREGAFVVVNCAEIPQDVQSLDSRTQALSLLFGHVRGSFAGAETDRDGCFQLAHGGTLFFDEIGVLPLPLQSHLLRVLQQGEVCRIGEQKGRRVEARSLAATRMDLKQRVEEGAFRPDFYEYLSRQVVALPPLRQRPDDIPLLAEHFLRLCMREMGREAPALSPEVVEILKGYAFPGNVRELKNVVEQALLESGGREIRPEHVQLLAASGEA